MNILQVSAAYYPAVSIGGPIFSTLTFSEILQKNHQLTTLTTQQGLSKDQVQSINFDKYQVLSKNHKLIYKKYWGPSNFTFSFSMIFWLLKNASKYDLVVLQGVWNFPFIISAFFARLFDVPYVIFPHGSLYKETVFLKSSLTKKWMYFLTVKKMLKSARLICFTTKDEEMKVKEFLKIPLNSFVIPNVVKFEDFTHLPERGFWRKKFSIPSDSLILLHLGRISKKKGIISTLETLSTLLNQGYNIHFLIAGGDQEGYLPVIKNKINELNLEKFVHFTGLLNRYESLQAFVDSDIFVLPSLSENFGISIVEAMYCQLPVIISNQVGIAPDLKTNKAGIVVEMDGIEIKLAFELENLIKNPEKRNQLGIQGKTYAQANYDVLVLEKLVEKLVLTATQ